VTIRDVIAASIAGAVRTLVEHDPGVRLGGDAEHVGLARVAAKKRRGWLKFLPSAA